MPARMPGPHDVAALPTALLLACAASLSLAPPARAQWRTPPTLPPIAAQPLPQRPPAGGDVRPVTPATIPAVPRRDMARAATPEPGFGGVIAGTAATLAGVVAGGVAGYQLDRHHFHWGCANGCEDPGLTGLVGGAVAGSGLFTPLAVHLVNGRRGSLLAGYGAAALLGGAGTAIVAAAGAAPAAFLLLVLPPAQIISAYLIEQDSAP